MDATTSFIDLKGDIRIKEEGLLFAARYTAGPDPIDLPHTTIFSCFIPISFTR